MANRNSARCRGPCVWDSRFPIADSRFSFLAAPGLLGIDAQALRGGAHVGVSDGDRQCVGSVGLQLAIQVEHDADHVLHLHLVGAALADQRQFDFFGRVLVHRQIAHDHRADRRAARVAELERRSGTLAHEHLFDRDFIRPIDLDQLAQALQQALEPLGEIPLAQQHQRRVVHMPAATALVDVDDADAGALRTRIDAQDAGHRAAGNGKSGIGNGWSSLPACSMLPSDAGCGDFDSRFSIPDSRRLGAKRRLIDVRIHVLHVVQVFEHVQ
ncbi:hypothetical protein XAC2852_590079 [Xanthomonas citri pv. citri]|nr:hypothetical protein XAC2852_590079 [Xanthomonas citri pv. citri]